MTHTADRRKILQLAAAAASTLWLPRSAWSQRRFGDNPFTLGVASGSPTHDSVVLWTRLALPGPFGGAMGRDPVTVRWEVADDARFTRILQSGQSQALVALAHSVHVEVPNLAPDRWYFYRFMAGDAVSPTGRTRTFPAPDALAARLRVAYASCQRWEHGYYGAYRHMLGENLDVVLFLGDYIYEYPGATHPVRTHTGGWARSLGGFRDRHALHKSEPELQAMHAACPWLVTWDDHEVQNDYAGLQSGNSGPVELDFASRRAAAYQAFYEHMPLRASVLTRATAGLAQGAEMRIHSQVRFGRLASLHTLDARQYKDPQACSPPGQGGSAYLNPETCPQWDDPARTMLGPAQERWLDDSFARNRDATWTVIGQQSLFGQRDTRPGPQRYLWNDGWDGYTPARTRLTDSLRRHAVANPVLFGGDVHENWVGHVKADYDVPSSPSVGVEFCGTSLTSRSSAGNDKKAQRLADNPHFIFADGLARGYGVAEFTPARMTVSLRAVEDVTRRDTGVRTLAEFAVAAGRHLVEVA
ncbi:MAG: alkaline phosphatase [Comamonadaceae bacterium]|nr:MAG: alkaline phosphatase [Comamonadaceae bacterium]